MGLRSHRPIRMKFLIFLAVVALAQAEAKPKPEADAVAVATPKADANAWYGAYPYYAHAGYHGLAYWGRKKRDAEATPEADANVISLFCLKQLNDGQNILL